MSTVSRHAGKLYLAAACVFCLLTVDPVHLLDPFARTRVDRLRGGGLRIHEGGLLASGPGPAALDRPSIKGGRFALELTIRPDRDDVHGPRIIAAHGHLTRGRNWLVGQSGTALQVRSRGRRHYFHGLLQAGRRHHFVVSFDKARVSVFCDGELREVATLRGRPGPWCGDARLMLANLISGDRPWGGEIERLRVFDRPLSPADAARLFRDAHEDGAADNAAVNLVGTPGGPVALREIRWPWSLKLRGLFFHGYFDRWGTPRDLVANVVIGVPLGLLLALRLAGRSAATRVAVAAGAQLALSLFVETAQFFSMYRHAEPMDVLANVAGAAAGALLARSHPVRRRIGSRDP